MPRTFVLFSIFLPAIAACGGNADKTIDITYDYRSPLIIQPAADATDSERASIAEAIDMWNRLGLTQLALEGDEAGEGEAGDEAVPRVPVSFRDAAPSFFGLYEDEVGEVFINRRFKDPRARAITVAHELGHVFGLEHVEKDDHVCVMNPANLVEPPNEFDSSALKALGGN